MLISQPSESTPLQLRNEPLQDETTHVAAVQPGTAFERLQGRLQAPQCCASVLMLRSQPVPYCPSQSMNGAVQLSISQVPLLQSGMPLVTAHWLLQAPQCARSVFVLRSQPVP